MSADGARLPRSGTVSRPGMRSAFPDAIAQLLREGTAVLFEARGESMRPTILPGDQLVVRPFASGKPLRRGAIVLCSTPEGTLEAHRVVGFEGSADRRSFVTLGDACLAPARRVTPADVLGLAVTRMRGARTCAIDRVSWLTSTWLRAAVRRRLRTAAIRLSRASRRIRRHSTATPRRALPDSPHRDHRTEVPNWSVALPLIRPEGGAPEPPIMGGFMHWPLRAKEQQNCGPSRWRKRALHTPGPQCIGQTACRFGRGLIGELKHGHTREDGVASRQAPGGECCIECR